MGRMMTMKNLLATLGIARRGMRGVGSCRWRKPALLATALLPALLAANLAHAINVTLAWDASTTADVVGYNLYYGRASLSYTNLVPAGSKTSVTVSNLTAGLYYFAVTAIDLAGLESSFSTEVVLQLTTPLPAGERLTLTKNASRQMVINGQGAPGYVFDVLWGTNLTTWTRLGSVTNNASGTCRFTDTASTTARSRFYRLKRTSP